MREREVQRRIGSHRSSAQTAAPLDTPISITGVRRVINSRGGGGDGGDGGNGGGCEEVTPPGVQVDARAVNAPQGVYGRGSFPRFHLRRD